MFGKLSLGLLLSTGVVWGQPVEGPYPVIESSAAIHHIHVAARNDSVADVFCQVGNDAYHVGFALDLGILYAGPDPFAPPDSGYVRTLEDAIRVGDGWRLVAYDEDPTYNATVVFTGADAIADSQTVDAGATGAPMVCHIVPRVPATICDSRLGWGDFISTGQIIGNCILTGSGSREATTHSCRCPWNIQGITHHLELVGVRVQR